MLLTPEQLEAIRQVIRDHMDSFIANAIGPDTLPKEVIDRLKDLGLFKPQLQMIHDAYKYGAYLGTTESKTAVNIGLGDFREATQDMALTSSEQHAMRMAATQAGQYVTGLGQKIASQVTARIVEADRIFSAQDIQDETARAIARRKSVSQLASDLRWAATNEWAKDWDRIAMTEKHTAMQHGLADHYRSKFGNTVRVAKRPMPTACKHCKKAYLGSDGHPKIFVLEELTANGDNVGRKAADWLPTLSSLHPHCQCVLIRIPDGWGFDEDGDLSPSGKFGEIEKGFPTSECDCHDDHCDHPLQKGFPQTSQVTYQGLPIVIETPAGTERHWKDREGNSGTTKMLYDYGYVAGTHGVDGDEVDVYIGPDPHQEVVYIVEQKNPHDDTYDEQKCMLGFPTQEAAIDAYLAHLDRDDFFFQCSSMLMDQFKRWLGVGQHLEPRSDIEDDINLHKAGDNPALIGVGLDADNRNPSSVGGELTGLDEFLKKPRPKAIVRTIHPNQVPLESPEEQIRNMILQALQEDVKVFESMARISRPPAKLTDGRSELLKLAGADVRREPVMSDVKKRIAKRNPADFSSPEPRD